jgi:quinoprotein glucose dehydrogenase
MAGRLRRGLVRLGLGLAIVAVIAAVIGSGVLQALQFHPPQARRTWSTAAPRRVADTLDWTAVGGDTGQGKFSPLAQIDPGNVGRLKVAWIYRTGEAARRGSLMGRAKFEATPIIAGGAMVLCTPFDRAVAVDPASGRQVWAFDAGLDVGVRYANDFNCRGLARWVDPAAPARAPCAERVFMATNDRRLFALDARTGARCAGFGHHGELTVIPAAEIHSPGEVQIVAAPAVIGAVVVVGSSVADSQRADAAAGKVHAFDARTGALKWTFDPLPGANGRTGGGNVWSSISGDPERNLVFLPTTSPSPDFFGGGRAGDEGLADSIVAVRADSGRRVWSFQTVHHDLWDYDIPAAPALFTLHRGTEAIPALAFATKQGFLFVLNRETGAPLYRVEERAVPATDVPGERTSPTQPFSTLPVLAPQAFAARDAFGVLGYDAAACRRKLARARNEGLFTPPSRKGSVEAPTTGGGANWGGVAIDPRTNRLIVNTTSAVELIQLVSNRAWKDGGGPMAEASAPQSGAPYAVRRGAVLSPLGMPCNPPPWGLLDAVDLDTGKLAWRRTLGTTSSLAPLGIALPWGTPNVGGPLITGGGIVFIAATMEQRLRAFDTRTGEELWAGELPASAQASPMTYAIGGRQFVVIAAGGHSVLGTRRGDYLVAFALPAR